MARRLIVDTGVLITSERARSAVASVVKGDDDLVVAAITVAELLTGVELSDERHREARRKFVDLVLQTFPIEPYDLEVARVHASLLAHVYRGGTKRGAHNLIIAATAVATDRVLLTKDRRAQFEDLPGVQCIVAD